MDQTMNSRILTNLAAITAYTLIPLVGVLLLGWDWRSVLIFYWLGNISTGLAVLIDIFKLPPNSPNLAKNNKGLAVRIGEAIFFCLHYGLFTLVHGVFVFVLTSNEFILNDTTPPATPTLDIGEIIIAWALGTVLYLSLKSFDQRPATTSNGAIGAAYARMLTLHVSLIIGVFITVSLGAPSIAAIVLVLINFVVQVTGTVIARIRQ